jgi:hydrogenase maturation protease
MTGRRTLVAGIGNVFLGDDAFGVEVAQRLLLRDRPGGLPDGVLVKDFGIRGIHLAYELLDGYDALVLADAVPMGEPPGTLAVIEPQFRVMDGEDAQGAGDIETPAVDAHTMSPDVVLATLARLGGSVGHVLIVACQPADLSEGMGLSPAVAAAVDAAADLCLEVAADLSQPSERGINR